jgi:hypothetical protein
MLLAKLVTTASAVFLGTGLLPHRQQIVSKNALFGLKHRLGVLTSASPVTTSTPAVTTFTPAVITFTPAVITSMPGVVENPHHDAAGFPFPRNPINGNVSRFARINI